MCLYVPMALRVHVRLSAQRRSVCPCGSMCPPRPVHLRLPQWIHVTPVYPHVSPWAHVSPHLLVPPCASLCALGPDVSSLPPRVCLSQSVPMSLGVPSLSLWSQMSTVCPFVSMCPSLFPCPSTPVSLCGSLGCGRWGLLRSGC